MIYVYMYVYMYMYERISCESNLGEVRSMIKHDRDPIAVKKGAC